MGAVRTADHLGLMRRAAVQSSEAACGWLEAGARQCRMNRAAFNPQSSGKQGIYHGARVAPCVSLGC
jgi:hypothetical protein